MSAAIEAGIEGIPAIGFSLQDYRWNADFSNSKKFIKKITMNALKNNMPKGVVLNVNIPAIKESEIKGIKICRQAKAYWVEEFDKRKNPLGQEYYWLTGKFVNKDKGEDTDEWALNNGFISIVPVEFDLTAHFAIKDLNEWDFK
jgi:5'-nucleotidase